MESLLVTAGAGYGKTAALRRLCPPAGHHWADRDLVRQIAEGRLPPAQAAGRWLVIDDLPTVSAEVATAILGTAHVAVATRSPWPVSTARHRGQGILDVLGPDSLALDPAQVREVLRDSHDLADTSLAESVHALTLGWPALVRLAGQALARHPDVAHLGQPGSDIFDYIADEVLGPLPPAAARLAREVCELHPVTAPLCRALGRTGFDRLVADGIVRGQRMVPLVALVAAATARDTGRSRALAAAWFETNGPPVAAARAHLAAGDAARAAKILDEAGDQIIAHGEARELAEMVRALPEGLRTPSLRMRWGDALRTCGAVAEAFAVLSDLSAELERSAGDGLPVGVALRLGRVHYMRGEAQAALDTYARASEPADDPVDEALLHAWAATAHWMVGRAELARASAQAALTLARRLTGRARSRALSASHMALALVVKLDADIDAADNHEALSLRFAREAGDRIQESRVLANLAHQFLARSRFAEALESARAAIAIAEVTGPPGNLVVALVNEALALHRLGRLDESARSFTRVIAFCERIGSLRVAGALAGLGDLHRERGWSQQAGHCYRRALAIARESGERDAVLPALLGLALVTNDRELVDQAEALAPATVEVVLARGWLQFASGDLASAATCARTAAELAGAHLGRLAESLQLQAAATTEPEQARAALAEARNVWAGCGSAAAADRVAATLAKLPGATPADRLDASLAARRLAAAGVMPNAATIGLASATGNDCVEIRVLGMFEVRVGGQPVPAAAWQSRKARDLLRLLVARRGQAVPREELAEALWPNEEGSAHRLSVALSIARGALDPDRRHPADRYIIGDASKLALDPSLRIDVIDFLDAVSFGARLYDQDDPQARAALLAAHHAYTGEAFADDPYLDWLAPTRDLVRAAHLRTLRILARLARRAGDADEAVRWLLELLAHEPYDEAAHADLIAVLTTAGRRGEAQRARERYARAMRTLGVEAAPV